MLSEEDRLYTIPEDFKKKVEEAKVEFDTGANRGDEMDGEVGSGAQIAWNTGLAEIALPIEFKLKNMEDTLAARDKMESVRAARRNAPGASSSLSGSLTANYSHHQKEWALQIRALQNRQVCCVSVFLTVFAVGISMVLGCGGLSFVGHASSFLAQNWCVQLDFAPGTL
ncbi:unnamed protein product [Ectocarpus sp. 6 AP-2014]